MYKDIIKLPTQLTNFFSLSSRYYSIIPTTNKLKIILKSRKSVTGNLKPKIEELLSIFFCWKKMK